MRLWILAVAFVTFTLGLGGAHAQSRHALVVGIDTYDNFAPLEKARNDARDVADALRSIGFRTELLIDPDEDALLTTLALFSTQLEPGDEVVFFFAGHGVEIDGRNFLLPADVPAVGPGQELVVTRRALPVDDVIDSFQRRGVRLSLLILDACRDNPFPQVASRSVGRPRGLARTEAPEGTFIMYSAGAGQSALDSLSVGDTFDPARNSVFARALLPRLTVPGLELRDIVVEVRSEVRQMAGLIDHDQFPAVYDQLDGRFLFMPAALNPASQPKPDWTSASYVTLRGHTDPVWSAAFSPDGGRIVTGSRDQTARVWDARTERVIATLSGHTGAVFSAGFSSDGARVVTTSRDKTARIWDAATGHEITRLSGYTGGVSSAPFSPDGQRIVTASDDSTARIWDAETGREITTLSGHTSTLISAAFSPDGRRIVTTSIDKTARIWDAGTRHLIATLSGHEESLLRAAFSPDGGRVVTASSDNTARIWNAETGHLIVTMSGHEGRVWSAAFSPDGGRIVTASSDNTARIWDAETGREITTLSGHTGWVTEAVFSPDGERIVTASHDGTARIWTAK
ncbi:MAG: caspase family protein [Natronohydrobacter sp.]|nr:caspase family protein [Natronohydrobacter sp.]